MRIKGDTKSGVWGWEGRYWKSWGNQVNKIKNTLLEILKELMNFESPVLPLLVFKVSHSAHNANHNPT